MDMIDLCTIFAEGKGIGLFNKRVSKVGSVTSSRGGIVMKKAVGLQTLRVVEHP